MKETVVIHCCALCKKFTLYELIGRLTKPKHLVLNNGFHYLLCGRGFAGTYIYKQYAQNTIGIWEANGRYWESFTKL